MKYITVIFLIAVTLFCSGAGTPLWQWRLQSRCYADPVVDGKRVFVVLGAGEVISGRYETGEREWEQKLRGGIVATPAVSSGALFAATQNGIVCCLEKTTGKERWCRTFVSDAFEAPLSIAGDLILAPSVNGNLYPLAQSDGSTRWMHSGNRKYNTAAVVESRYIYIGGWDGDFLCLRQDGSIVWQWTAPAPIVENALIYKNLVVFGTLKV